MHPPKAGTLAQLVEQRTENPCVPGSIPGGTTQKAPIYSGLFCCYKFSQSFLLPIHQMDEAVFVDEGAAEHFTFESIEKYAIGME
ncbi:MAG: hypothetical protein RLZZ65_1648 [Bacteroidota bacterium]